MARTPTQVQLPGSMVAVLDRRAAARGISRSALIREALDAYLGDEHQSELAQRIVEGYTRLPQDEAQAVASTREMIAEEPW